MDDPDINFIQDNLYEYTKKDSGAVIIPHEKTSWLLNSGGINAYSSKLFHTMFLIQKNGLIDIHFRKNFKGKIM